ncbi:MAG: YtxH domain-containing protein [Candidatus Cyclobacteriaceae bacterium M3_2C_046]
MKSLKNNNSLGELITNFSTLMKYRLGISEPPKKKNNVAVLAVVSAVSGLALGIIGGILFAQESGDQTRKKLAKTLKDVSNKSSSYTNQEIARLNALTKDQIEKIKKLKKEAV